MGGNRRRVFRELIAADALAIVILFFVAFGLGFLINQYRDYPLPIIFRSDELHDDNQSDASGNPKLSLREHFDSSATVSVEQVKQFIKEKRGFVFDARPEIFYRLGHIPGSKSLPRQSFENAYQIYKTQLEADKVRPIVVYCSNPSCEDSTLVQKALKKLGHVNVSVFRGGWAEWEERELSEK